MSEETTEVKTSDLQEILKANRALQERVALLEQKATDAEPEHKSLKNISQRKAHVRMVDGKVVVGFVNHGSATRPRYVYNKKDPNNDEQFVQWVDIILEGEKEGVPVQYVSFLQEADRVVCPITHTKEIPWTIEQGETTVKEVNSDGLQIDTGVEVPVTIEGKDYVHTLRLPDGREIMLKSEYVNM